MNACLIPDDDSNALCDFQEHKRRLTDLFFHEQHSAIKRNSTAYSDFWKFVQRLQRAIKAKIEAGNNKNSLKTMCKRINICTTNYRLEDYIRHRDYDHRHSHSLTEANLQCFHSMYNLFIDYLQKQKFSRIVKLQKDKASLPIAHFRGQLLEQLSTNQIIVVAGDTGCGKSTQFPQYVHLGELDSDNQPIGTGYKQIAVTQPRRIACISLAARVSTEMLNERGSKVGYQVRFERSRTKATQILFLTEGLLLRQMQMDPFLKSYDVLILDEVHERHWQTDCLLGLVKCLVLVRPELRVILMSATINVNLFSKFFDDCPVIQVPGRLYPIDLRYMPLTPAEQAGEGDRLDPAPYIRLLQRIDATYPVTERGDLLIFVPGMADIQAIMEPAKAYAEQTKRWIILALHSTLPVSDQEKVFHVAPDGVRKCVLSTNIAETSLTIDGIRFVADSGKVKEMSWDPKARMRCLKEFPISKASANQRKGRAGRTGPGVCFRFYTHEDYEALEAFSKPEIRRVPLETLVLQMMVMGLPDVKRFPFIDPPEENSLDEALEILKAHGAVIESRHQSKNKNLLTVTPLGQLLADLPVDFSLGRMLIMASLLRLVDSALTLIAGMAVQCPLLPSTSFSGAEQTRRNELLAEFENDNGDAFTVANVFDEWIKIKADTAFLPDSETNQYDPFNDTAKAKSNARRWCRRVGVQEQRLHEIVRLRSQFRELLKEAGLLTKNRQDDQKPLVNNVQQRQHLNRARRTERMKTKRRRILTVQEDNPESSGSETEEESGKTEGAKLRKWLMATTSGSSRNMNLDSLDISVRDLELVLCYDLSGLADSANQQDSLTHADVQLLKVVLAGGLYPQLAIGDAANAYRVANRGGTAGAGAEMVFHTKTKNFVTLHPNDIFVRQPDALFPDPKERERVATELKHYQHEDEDSSLPDKISSMDVLPSGFAVDHQLLMYLDLMETTKPFLVNTIRVPALPTLLLYCREIDTNANATRIVFDSWLEVKLVDAEAAQRAIATTVWLRTTMERLMQLDLAECSRRRQEAFANDSGESANPLNLSNSFNESSPSTDRRNIQARCRRLQRLLAHSFVKFVAGRPGGLHTLNRLLAADVKQLFKRQRIKNKSENAQPNSKTVILPECDASQVELPDGIKINEEKGGYRITDYLTVDSLYSDNEPSNSADEAKCHIESSNNPVAVAQNLALRLFRQVVLASRETNSELEQSKHEPQTLLPSETVDDSCHIVCDQCGQSFPVEHESYQTTLLRHKRRCSNPCKN